MAQISELNRKQLLIEQHKLLIPGDFQEVLELISEPDPNIAIGINPKFIPPVTLNVMVDKSGKYLFLPESLGYAGPEAEIIGSVAGGWRVIRAGLTLQDRIVFIDRAKLGNGTAWEQGLQLDGPKSAPEWAGVVSHLARFAVDDPNYPRGKAPAKIVPSVIVPPPSLRRAMGEEWGSYSGMPLELRKMRRHELSHVVEMNLLPWPPENEFGPCEGLPSENGAVVFEKMMGENGATILDEEAVEIWNGVRGKGLMPRGLIGELQAYLGDSLFFAREFGSITGEDFRSWTESSLKQARVLRAINGNVRNYFGAAVARDVITQIGVEGTREFLNEIYERMAS